jgi:flavin-binding protein dodecin
MSVAKVIEIIASSKKSFEDAVVQGVSKAADSLHDITGAWIKEQSVKVVGGKVAEYRVNLKVTFVLKDVTHKVAPKVAAKTTKTKKK